MKRGFSGRLSHRKILIIGSVAIYVFLLLILLFVAWKEAGSDGRAVFESVEGRFLSDIVMTHDGETYYYRENEITNYLIVGSNRENADADTDNLSGGQAGILVILSVDRINRTVTPLMLDCDTMTPVQTFDESGQPLELSVMQLGLAETCSGAGFSCGENTAAAVEELLYGVKIDRCITVDLSAVPLANDAVGGVEVTLEDDLTAYDPAMAKGSTVRLNGEQAAYYVGVGKTVSDSADSSLAMRRWQYVSGFLAQTGLKSREDKELPIKLMNAVGGCVESDTPLLTLVWDMNRYKAYARQPLLTPKGAYTVDEFGNSEFWADGEALRELVRETWFAKAESH